MRASASSRQLAGVEDPEIKRKRIGETFIRVFEQEARQPRRRALPRAGHALLGRRRVRLAHRRQDQVAPQRRRPARGHGPRARRAAAARSSRTRCGVSKPYFSPLIPSAKRKRGRTTALPRSRFGLVWQRSRSRILLGGLFNRTSCLDQVVRHHDRVQLNAGIERLEPRFGNGRDLGMCPPDREKCSPRAGRCCP